MTRPNGMTRLATLSLLAMLVFGQAALSDDLVLVRDRAANCVIVTPAKPRPEEATAAEWLADTLKRVTGAAIPVKAEDAPDLPATRIVLGDTAAARAAGVDATKLRPEEWRVTTAGGSLVLAGGRPRGTIYAVCEFLETHVGVLRLDPFTEVIPSKPTLVVAPLDRAGRPAFPVRALFTGFPYGYPAGGGTLIEKFRTANRNNIDGRPAAGDHARFVPSGVHTFGNFLGSKEFAATHPEYFGMDAAGKRVTDDLGTPSAWTQLCVTNDDVRRIVLERARKFLRDDQAAATREGREPAKILCLSQNDNTANLCLCPQCKAVADREGSESGPLLEFVNHVARGLNAEFPDVVIQTEAYNFTLAAPKSLRPESNVVVRFCDNYGFSDPTRPLAHPRNGRPMKLFAGWQAKQCQLGLWDYWRVFQQHPPGFFAPSTNVRALRDDLRLFRKAGVELMTVECEDFLGAGINDDPVSADMQSFMPLRTWVGLKLLDDPERDLDALLDTFCRGYYGPAAKPMRSLLERIENRQAELPLRVVDIQRQVWTERFCDAAFLADAYSLLDEAMRATTADPFTQTHVRRERIIIDSVFLWLEEHLRRADPARAKTFPARADVLRRHRDDCRAWLATVFDEAGQKRALPILEAGVTLAEKLRPEDTLFAHEAVGADEKTVTLDGRLDEPFWNDAPVARLLPRDPIQPNDDPTTIRMAWTDTALYVGVEQPVDRAHATLGFTLMAGDRKGVQLSLYAPHRTGPIPLNPYFYGYDDNGGLMVVKDRKSASACAGAEAGNRRTTELKFLWVDIDAKVGSHVKGATNAAPDASDTARPEFVFNIETYPKPDSKVPSHVSSPWLVGRSPTWHSGYYKALRLSGSRSKSTP